MAGGRRKNGRAALITFSREGLTIARVLAGALRRADIYVHRSVKTASREKLRQSCRIESFESVMDLLEKLFADYRAIVFIGPAGIAVRAIAPHIGHKLSDPAVVVVDAGARWAVSLLSGHEGGANDLAIRVANAVGAEPVISTTTQARRNLIVGVGCRRGAPTDRIIAAIRSSLRRIRRRLSGVRLIASADIKADEKGLLKAAEKLDLPIVFIDSRRIAQCPLAFGRSEFVMKKTGLPGVAEPAALLAGKRTRLLLKKQTFKGLTVAIAVEDCPWSE